MTLIVSVYLDLHTVNRFGERHTPARHVTYLVRFACKDPLFVYVVSEVACLLESPIANSSCSMKAFHSSKGVRGDLYRYCGQEVVFRSSRSQRRQKGAMRVIRFDVGVDSKQAKTSAACRI